MDLPRHLSVLPNEVLDLLRPERGGVFVDATLGMGGHASLLLERAPGVRVIGIDQDGQALDYARERLGESITYAHGNFADLAPILKKLNISGVDGILMDLGVSSYQLDEASRGFSFSKPGPLDMRMNPTQQLTAAHIVNSWPEPKLADLIYEYGEDRLSRRIARLIVERRQTKPFKDTADLAYVIAGAYPPAARHKHPHPATRTFQALRIAVNNELGALKTGLIQAVAALNPGGVLAVISFHSLEDRIVKHFFREQAASGAGEILTKKPIEPSEDEERENSRSRSAKLRGFVKV